MMWILRNLRPIRAGLALIGACLAAGASIAATDEARVAPTALVETEPVPSAGDAADDPAIWIHPDDPALSLLLGTDKKGGLHVYTLDGRDRQTVSPGTRPNNVDILYGFPLGGRPVDLAIAGSRAKDSPGAKVWIIDPSTRTVAEIAPGRSFQVFGGGEPYGSCVYRGARTAQSYWIVNDHDGAFEQYRLIDAGDGTIKADKVRSFKVGLQSEGCVADDELGNLFIAEEDVGIWKYGAEPDSGDGRTLIARVGEHGLAADVEGLALYKAAAGKGYLLASSQGNSTIQVYERDGSHPFVLTIDPVAATVGDVDETDGLDVTNRRTTSQFPRGLLVLQDGKNRGKNQNFKLFSWEEIAGGRLRIDPDHPVRPR